MYKAYPSNIHLVCVLRYCNLSGLVIAFRVIHTCYQLSATVLVSSSLAAFFSLTLLSRIAPKSNLRIISLHIQLRTSYSISVYLNME